MNTTVELIIRLVIGLATITPLVIKLVEYVQKSIKEKNWQNMIKLAFKLMADAEKMFDKGADRLEYVVSMVKAAASEINYDIDETALRQLINDTISLTKVVNVAPEDKLNEEN